MPAKTDKPLDILVKGRAARCRLLRGTASFAEALAVPCAPGNRSLHSAGVANVEINWVRCLASTYGVQRNTVDRRLVGSAGVVRKRTRGKSQSGVAAEGRRIIELFGWPVALHPSCYRIPTKNRKCQMPYGSRFPGKVNRIHTGAQPARRKRKGPASLRFFRDSGWCPALAGGAACAACSSTTGGRVEAAGTSNER